MIMRSPASLKSAILRFVFSFIVFAASVDQSLAASLTWDWNYSGSGLLASGTFTTSDTPDSSGYYLMTGITGTRNGDTITSLVATGTSIPGNSPFTIDNLVKINGQQLTGNGFGFATAGGNFSNLFFASFLPTPSVMEFYSASPFSGGVGPEDSELPVSFSASLQTTVPEPDIVALILIGFSMLYSLRWRKGSTYKLNME